LFFGIFKWAFEKLGLSFVAIPLRSIAALRAASSLRFVTPALQTEALLSATLATIRPGVELIPCNAPAYLALSSAIHGGTRHKQRTNKQPGKPGTQQIK